MNGPDAGAVGVRDRSAGGVGHAEGGGSPTRAPASGPAPHAQLRASIQNSDRDPVTARCSVTFAMPFSTR